MLKKTFNTKRYTHTHTPAWTLRRTNVFLKCCWEKGFFSKFPIEFLSGQSSQSFILLVPIDPRVVSAYRAHMFSVAAPFIWQNNARYNY